MTYEVKNKFKESERLLNRIIKKDNNHFNALRALGDIYFQQKKVEKSYKVLNLAKNINNKVSVKKLVKV